MSSISLYNSLAPSTLTEAPPLTRNSSTDHKLSEVFYDHEKCEGISDHAHRVFLVTNESGQTETLGKMRRHPMNGNTMVGVSGFFVLNAAAVRAVETSNPEKKVKYLVLLDRSQRVNDFWNQMQCIITQSSSRDDVITQVKDLLLDKKDFYYTSYTSPDGSLSTAKYYIAELDREIVSGASWLSSDEKYQRIKEIFDANHFVCLQQNLCNKRAMDALAGTMEERGMTLDTLYLSNTREYAEMDSLLEVYQESLDKLITARVFVIDTKPRIGGCTHHLEELTQRVFRRNQSPLSICFPLSSSMTKTRTTQQSDGKAFETALKEAMAKKQQKKITKALRLKL